METNNSDEYRKLMRELFRTPQGIEAIKILELYHVRPSAFTPDPIVTAYNLGQKELVQQWIEDAQTEELNLQVIGGIEDEY